MPKQQNERRGPSSRTTHVTTREQRRPSDLRQPFLKVEDKYSEIDDHAEEEDAFFDRLVGEGGLREKFALQLEHKLSSLKSRKAGDSKINKATEKASKAYKDELKVAKDCRTAFKKMSSNEKSAIQKIVNELVEKDKKEEKKVTSRGLNAAQIHYLVYSMLDMTESSFSLEQMMMITYFKLLDHYYSQADRNRSDFDAWEIRRDNANRLAEEVLGLAMKITDFIEEIDQALHKNPSEKLIEKMAQKYEAFPSTTYRLIEKRALNILNKNEEKKILVLHKLRDEAKTINRSMLDKLTATSTKLLNTYKNKWGIGKERKETMEHLQKSIQNIRPGESPDVKFLILFQELEAKYDETVKDHIKVKTKFFPTKSRLAESLKEKILDNDELREHAQFLKQKLLYDADFKSDYDAQKPKELKIEIKH